MKNNKLEDKITILIVKCTQCQGLNKKERV